jgi:nifR3 family TIM-barrel protein
MDSSAVPVPPAHLSWGSLPLASRFVLAPLAGYTNWAFRRSVRALGGLGLATTDLVNPRALLRASRKSLELIHTCPLDRPVAVQLYGAEAPEMADAARMLEERGYSAIDINMGCPVNKVTKGGGGSAMLCNRDQTINLVRTVVEAVRLPVSVKMRLGWDDAQWSAPFFAREFERAGVAGLTVHGRTRDQGFTGHVKLAGIRAVVEAVERIPVLGNGDVRTQADAARMLAETGCTGIAIGRGALLNPWIFAQLHAWDTGREPPAPTYEQRLAFMERHFFLRLEEQGEHYACLTFRKVGRWYSRVLRPGRELHRRIMFLGAVDEFRAIVAELRERGAPAGDGAGEDWTVPVPAGPNERW